MSFNPFGPRPDVPPNSHGRRGYSTAADAKTAAQATGAASFAIIRHPNGTEFAWLAPAQAFMARVALALHAGIHLVELGEKR